MYQKYPSNPLKVDLVPSLPYGKKSNKGTVFESQCWCKLHVLFQFWLNIFLAAASQKLYA